MLRGKADLDDEQGRRMVLVEAETLFVGEISSRGGSWGDLVGCIRCHLIHGGRNLQQFVRIEQTGTQVVFFYG
jgi:hypothetical protein